MERYYIVSKACEGIGWKTSGGVRIGLRRQPMREVICTHSNALSEV